MSRRRRETAHLVCLQSHKNTEILPNCFLPLRHEATASSEPVSSENTEDPLTQKAVSRQPDGLWVKKHLLWRMNLRFCAAYFPFSLQEVVFVMQMSCCVSPVRAVTPRLCLRSKWDGKTCVILNVMCLYLSCCLTLPQLVSASVSGETFSTR